MTAHLYQITAPGYVAGILVDGDRVTAAAPILRWTVGRAMQPLREYMERRGYGVRQVEAFDAGTMT